MDQQFIDVLLALSKIAPVVAVLWLGIKFFIKKNTEYENKIDEQATKYQSKIDELQVELRNNEKESLQVMNRLTGVLDKLLENSAEDKKEILAEIASIHKDLTKKLNDIKKG